MLFFGIDVGTQGVRGVICDEKGNVQASAECGFVRFNSSRMAGRYEQEPEVWWESAVQVISGCVKELKTRGIPVDSLMALSIDGTSGTIVPVNAEGRELRSAIMYNDMRSVGQAELIHMQGYSFNASFALPKILWIKENQPQIYEKTDCFIHQTDYLVGKLTGNYRVTDYSNALKTGYDLAEEKWPAVIKKLGLDMEKFPTVLPPGKVIGKVHRKMAEELGLPKNMMVTGGATDGYSSALAAGAVKVGDWASIIGTTLVLKGITSKRIANPGGGGYSHKLPSGAWMFGGASNIGGRCLNDFFSKEEFPSLNKKVEKVIPTGVLSYPLHGRGERFPFLDLQAEAFYLGDMSRREVRYAALMEGVAYAERLAFERMESFGAAAGNSVCTTGGACKSEEWLKIRASVLNRQLKVPKVTGAAVGSALLAAGGTWYTSLEEASGVMISFEKTVEPDKSLVGAYDELYYRAYEEYRRRYTFE